MKWSLNPHLLNFHTSTNYNVLKAPQHILTMIISYYGKVDIYCLFTNIACLHPSLISILYLFSSPVSILRAQSPLRDSTIIMLSLSWRLNNPLNSWLICVWCSYGLSHTIIYTGPDTMVRRFWNGHNFWCIRNYPLFGPDSESYCQGDHTCYFNCFYRQKLSKLRPF